MIVAPAIPVPFSVLSVDNTRLLLVVGVTVGAAGLATLSCDTSTTEPSEKVTLTTLFVSFVVPAANVGFPFNV